MHTLHITVAGKVATYSARDGSIICGNDDYQVQFALDSEWDGLAAKARFRWNGKHQDVPIVDGLAAVPRISNANEVKVGVYSEDGSLQTTTAARVPCDKSILCGASAPTEGNEAHYASEAQEAADRAEAAARRAEAAESRAAQKATDAENAAQEAATAATEASQAKEAAEAAQSKAEGARDTAVANAEAASTSATVAAREAGNASKSAAAAATDRTAAETAAGTATSAKIAAEAARDTASQKATEATNAAQTATSEAAAAAQANIAAQTARTDVLVAAQRAEEAAQRAEEATGDEYVLCETIPDDADTSKKYVPSDGYIYVYEKRQVEITHDANDGTGYRNYVPTGTWGNSQGAKQGMWTSPLITFDPTEFGVGKNREQTNVTISGLDKLVPAYNGFAVVVYYYFADGTQKYMKTNSDIKNLGVAQNNEISLPRTFYLYDGNFLYNDDYWTPIRGVRISLGIKSGVDITADDIANLKVNIPFFDRKEEVWGWYSTGQKYTADENVMKNTADIAELRERMTSAEEDVAGLRESATEINTNSVLYAVGDSITYGSGADGYGTIDAGWVKHVIARNGYDTSNSKNLGVVGIGFVQIAPGSTNKLRDIVDSNSFAPADDVIVAAGINDWKNYQIALADFWAEMKYCLTKIRTDNPYCRIFYVLPYNCKASGWKDCTYDSHWALGYRGDNSADRCFGYILKDFRKLILDKFETDEDLKALGVHVVSIMPITRGNIDQITVDGLHPNAEGYKIIGSLLSQIAATT